jgi:translation initiation factor 2A
MSPKSAPKKQQKQAPIQGAVTDGAIDLEKKIRTIQKKLKQIQELKVKRDAGETLELTQISKIESESTLQTELESLESKLNA